MVLSGEGADEIFAGYLYFHKCPNPEEMQAELKDKIRSDNLNFYIDSYMNINKIKQHSVIAVSYPL